MGVSNTDEKGPDSVLSSFKHMHAPIIHFPRALFSWRHTEYRHTLPLYTLSSLPYDCVRSCVLLCDIPAAQLASSALCSFVLVGERGSESCCCCCCTCRCCCARKLQRADPGARSLDVGKNNPNPTTTTTTTTSRDPQSWCKPEQLQLDQGQEDPQDHHHRLWPFGLLLSRPSRLLFSSRRQPQRTPSVFSVRTERCP